MKIIYIVLFVLPLFSINGIKQVHTNVKSKTPKQEICKPSNDGLITLPGILNLDPVTESEGDIYSHSFESLKNWEKRKTKPRVLFENAEFSPDNVTIKNNILNITVGYLKEKSTNCIDEFGGQVQFTKSIFSPGDEYTYSAIMKPTDKPGVVSAFFLHLIDKNTNNPGYCKNNNEIDIEVVKYGHEADPSLRGKIFAYFTSWTRALNPWGYKGDPCAADPATWDQRQRESHGIQLDERFTKEFHKYSFTWKKNEILFYIDDKFMARHTKIIPQKKCPLKINVWANQNWLGYSKNDSFTAVTQVKMVSISSKEIK